MSCWKTRHTPSTPPAPTIKELHWRQDDTHRASNLEWFTQKATEGFSVFLAVSSYLDFSFHSLQFLLTWPFVQSEENSLFFFYNFSSPSAVVFSSHRPVRYGDSCSAASDRAFDCRHTTPTKSQVSEKHPEMNRYCNSILFNSIWHLFYL